MKGFIGERERERMENKTTGERCKQSTQCRMLKGKTGSTKLTRENLLTKEERE